MVEVQLRKSGKVFSNYTGLGVAHPQKKTGALACEP